MSCTRPSALPRRVRESNVAVRRSVTAESYPAAAGMRVLRPLQTGRLNAPQIGFAVFLRSFTLFAVTTSRLVGYEPETAAVTGGLVAWGAADH